MDKNKKNENNCRKELEEKGKEADKAGPQDAPKGDRGAARA